MPDDDQELRPETYALDSLIQATIRRAQRAPGTQDAMLFMGNWHQAFPTQVVRDPVLEPVDKLVWMVVMLHARETGGRAAFPSYDTLASQTNIASTSTIARAIAILRLTRWLSLCARLRARTGQFQGNVYVLHDEPLPLADALYLDENYMAFTQQSRQHSHARVRKVAHAVLGALTQEIQAGHDPLAPVGRLEQRARTALANRHRDNSMDDKKPRGARRFQDMTDGILQQLNNRPDNPAKPERTDQNQNSKAVKEQEVEGCSSSTLKTTTTTTHKLDTPMVALCEIPLIFPARLSENQKALAEQYLVQLPMPLRQALLDELIGRLQAESYGAKPLYDELRFLHALCRAAKQGDFVPNLGLKVAEARLQRHAHTQSDRTSPPQPPTSDADRQAQKRAAQEHLRSMLQNLGLPPTK
jgi:hypothetical protein